MGYIVLGALLLTAIVAFKKKMWFLFIFCCVLILLGVAAFAYLVNFANHFSNPNP